MKEVRKILKKFTNGEKGQGMIEYGLILALISVVSITSLTGIGDKVKNSFDNVVNTLEVQGSEEDDFVEDNYPNFTANLYSGEEIDAKISAGYIPVSSVGDLSNIHNLAVQTFGEGTAWEKEYTSGLDKKYIQVADIDLSGVVNFSTINVDQMFVSIPFTGEYDGGGYTIDNLKMNYPSTDRIGLFGVTNGATLKHIGLTNVDIVGNDDVGGLIGMPYNSTVVNCYATGKVSGNSNIGGLIGSQYNSSNLVSSYSTVRVTGTGNGIGGLIGYNNVGSVSDSGWATDINSHLNGIGRSGSGGTSSNVTGQPESEIEEMIKNLIK